MDSLFILGKRGNVVVEKHWRQPLNRQIIEPFWAQVVAAERPIDVAPATMAVHHVLLHVVRNEICLIGAVGRDVTPLLTWFLKLNPQILLLVIAFSQMGTWAKIKYRGNLPQKEPIAHVWASQFDWQMQYPGADGVFGTWDDIESPHLFKVPVDENVVFILHSRDVLHSFFVPEFRLKQDAVPGMAIPIWFNSKTEGIYDLICTELCGWGHYKMAGRVEVVSREEYDAWMEDQKTIVMSNGTEEQS